MRMLYRYSPGKSGIAQTLLLTGLNTSTFEFGAIDPASAPTIRAPTNHKYNSQYPENKASHSGESKNGQSNSFRLLGALPGLGPKDSHKDDVKLALALELPSNFKKDSTNKENQNSDSGKMNSSKTLGVPTVSIPLYFPYILYNW